MKKVSLFILISGLIFSLSCKKDSTVTDIFTASLSCKINGTTWTALTRYTTIQANNFIITGTSIIGSDVLNITILGISSGTYNIDPLSGQIKASATYTNSATKTDSLYTAFTGIVILTAVDESNKTISGTFTFDAKNSHLATKKITEGSFANLKYQ